MNKFVLGIFVILAIGMADLPSTLACSPDMLHQLAKLTTTTTTTSTQSPGNLDLPAPAPAPQPVLPAAAPVIDGMPEPAPYIPLDPLNSIVISDYTPIIDGYREQPRSIDAGRNVFELEMEGFSICNTDGTEGLTFDEITACRNRLGDFVAYSWPTASEFDDADDNKDGNLTKAEFVQFIIKLE